MTPCYVQIIGFAAPAEKVKLQVDEILRRCEGGVGSAVGIIHATVTCAEKPKKSEPHFLVLAEDVEGGRDTAAILEEEFGGEFDGVWANVVQVYSSKKAEG